MDLREQRDAREWKRRQREMALSAKASAEFDELNAEQGASVESSVTSAITGEGIPLQEYDTSQLRSTTVTDVLDGDTIKINPPIAGRDTVRFAEIDAPEKDQPYGSESQKYLEDRLLNQEIELQAIKSGTYDRLIGNVFEDGTNIGQEMVKQGLAWEYDLYSTDPELGKLEKEARSNETGLWDDQLPIEPSTWRHDLTVVDRNDEYNDWLDRERSRILLDPERQPSQPPLPATDPLPEVGPSLSAPSQAELGKVVPDQPVQPPEPTPGDWVPPNRTDVQLDAWRKHQDFMEGMRERLNNDPSEDLRQEYRKSSAAPASTPATEAFGFQPTVSGEPLMYGDAPGASMGGGRPNASQSAQITSAQGAQESLSGFAVSFTETINRMTYMITKMDDHMREVIDRLDQADDGDVF